MAKKKIKKTKRPKPKKSLKVKKPKASIKKFKAKAKAKPRLKTKAKPHKKAVSAKLKKKKMEPMARLLLPLGRIKEIFRTRYGFFLYDGSEFVINNPETPSPWCNILTNGDYGMIISQAGGGMSFRGGMDNRITRWQQDIKSDNYGKFVYIRDNQTQQFWSATWKPVCKQPEFYEVRHGIGYTNISSQNNGIISSLIYYVAADEPAEVWQMRIRNITDQERFLSVFSYLEWDFDYPSGNREYDQFFVDTSFNEALSAVFARTPASEYAFHSVNHKVATFTCGRDFFLGSYRDASTPRGVKKGMCFGEQGRYKNVKVVEEEFSRACQRWTLRFNSFQITTPDEGANILTNKWFRYQAISAGLSSLGAYHNPGQAVKFKDHLINGLVLLSVNPKYHRALLLSCAEREFEDGSVIEEWDPRTLEGEKSTSLEIPLWLVYSVGEYLKETQDISVLEEEVKFQDAPRGSLFTHCTKVINRTLDSIGKRGLPPIANGDYMRRLDGASKDTRGESVWLGQFLVYLLSEFIEVCNLRQEKALIADYENRLKKLKDRLKKIAWDEDRFVRAISHTGRAIGLSKGKNARLFLDTQVWAVLSGLCEQEQALALMDNVESQLYRTHGPLLLSPSFTEYDEEAGTISKLPPGIMDNGGISLETACWAIWAETRLGRANQAWSMYAKLNPVDRSHKSDIYKSEPYVCCEYVDGPDSPTDGCARNSWYNRGAYWMFKVMTEEILGIKPTLEGLLISPCISNRWSLFRVRRIFRNAYYTIEVTNPKYVSTGIAEVIVDGKRQKSNLIPVFGDEKRHHVKVVMGKPKG